MNRTQEQQLFVSRLVPQVSVTLTKVEEVTWVPSLYSIVSSTCVSSHTHMRTHTLYGFGNTLILKQYSYKPVVSVSMGKA